MSGGVKYIGKIKSRRWFSYNQKVKITALPTLPGTQNLNSFHILDSAEEKAI